MNAAAKDIIYIDIDDEITGIIEKVQTAEHKIVALVLPKRAAVLQSIVNMKLLKRSGDEAKKHLVLITSEAGLMPLAGAVGLHVAKTLQTRPAVPTAPKIHDGNLDVDEPVDAEEEEPLDASKPIGLLAGLRGRNKDDEEETIEVDNDDKAPEELDEPVKKPSKKLKVPNFNRFRNRLFLGGAALVLLLIFWYLAAFTMPRANILVKTDTSSESTQVEFSTNPKASSVDLAERVIPSVVETVEKTDSEKVTATGEKNNGNKASGTVNMGANNCNNLSTPSGVPAGTTLTAGGVSYVTQEAATFEFDDINGGCVHFIADQISIIAKEGGSNGNKSNASFTVSGRSDVTATGSASGGTDQTIKVLSQKDFDAAVDKIAERAQTEVENELRGNLEAKSYYAIIESMVTGEPEHSSSPKVGEEASEATITTSIKYTMTGVKAEHLDELLKDGVKDKVDTDREMIQSTGLFDGGIVRISEKKADGKVSGNVQSIVVIGPKLNVDELKKLVAGKKRSETQQLIEDLPGVREVTIGYSPFWVFSTPGNPGKISITLEQASSTNGN